MTERCRLRRRRAASLSTFLMALVALLVAGPRASAAENDALIAKGRELRSAGKDREALPHFQKAVEQQRSPRAVAQLGLCEQALGMWVEAEGHLEEALRSEADPWVKKNRSALRGAVEVASRKLGSIEVWGTPDGAKVSVDGAALGMLPVERRARVLEGQHIVTVESPGFLTVTRTVEVRPGELSRERVTLLPVATSPQPVSANPGDPPLPPPDPIAPPPAPSSSSSSSALAAAPDAGLAASSAPATTPVYKRWWFWTIVGTVAVAAGVTTVYLLTRDGSSCPASPMGGTCDGW